MNKEKKKIELRSRRHKRVRSKITGTGESPRVSLFRSNKHIYAQVILDNDKKTVLAQSDIGITVKKFADNKDLKNKEKIAFEVGKSLAEKMKKNSIVKAKIDRGGFKYHGRIKALVEGIREGGIKI